MFVGLVGGGYYRGDAARLGSLTLFFLDAVQVIEEAAREPLEATHEKDMEVPKALMSQEEVRVCLV